MSFIYQQLNSFLNLGICKEYPSMARSKFPSGSRQKGAGTNNLTSTEPVSSGATQTEVARADTKDAKKVLGVVKSDSRPHVVPINLEDEIRRRAYELAE